MKRNKKFLAALGAVLCVLLTAWAMWDAVANHGGRLVYPMDSYAFQPSDIPMIAALLLDTVYIIALFAALVLTAYSQRKQAESTNRTRRLSPRFGFLGILGLAGFIGFYTYTNYGEYFPFCFFAFFGFFGFFYEGKMSNTFMDERFRENALRAERDAYSTGIKILFLLLVIAGQGHVPASLTLPALLIGISLDLALTLFLSEYLLYRYDHSGAMELEEE
ncbi:MAG: DUF3796 domain-containing protein [Oscillospiraceae bacterium]|nr:DUF3796 domain-containing protein [Oscillospiraceae bacterium]